MSLMHIHFNAGHVFEFLPGGLSPVKARPDKSTYVDVHVWEQMW